MMTASAGAKRCWKGLISMPEELPLDVEIEQLERLAESLGWSGVLELLANWLRGKDDEDGTNSEHIAIEFDKLAGEIRWPELREPSEDDEAVEMVAPK